MRKLCLLLFAGCMPIVQQPPPPRASASAQVDAHMNARIEKARVAAKDGGADEAWRFAKEVENLYLAKSRLAKPELVTEALGYLDASSEPKTLAEKGSLLITVGRKEEGVKALEESFKTPNLWPVAKLLEAYSQDRQLEIVVVCKKARGVTKNDDERYAVLDQCMHWGHDLAWASKDDVAFYKQQRAADESRAAQEAAAYRQQQEEERAKLYASFNKPEAKATSPSSSPSASGPVSVTIRSACAKTVRIFYGDKPKFGSGTTSSISSNSIQSHSFRVGEQMWIVDEHDNGISNAQISSSTREIEVGCTGLMTR